MSDLVTTLQAALATGLVLYLYRVVAGWLVARGVDSIEGVTRSLAVAGIVVLALSLLNALLVPLTGHCLTFRGDDGCMINGAFLSFRLVANSVFFLVVLRFALQPVLVRISARTLAILNGLYPSPLLAPRYQRPAFYAFFAFVALGLLGALAMHDSR